MPRIPKHFMGAKAHLFVLAATYTFALLPTSAFPQATATPQTSKSPADVEFSNLFRIGFDAKHLATQSLEFRKRGLAFYHKYPDDLRRYDWLELTSLRYVPYFADVDLADRIL